MSAISSDYDDMPYKEVSSYSLGDSTLMKILSYVPIIGLIPSIIQQSRIFSEIEKVNATGGNERLIELISTKNEYKKADTIRSVMTAVFFVVAAAAQVIFPLLGLLFAFVAALYLRDYIYNQFVIADLKEGKPFRGVR